MTALRREGALVLFSAAVGIAAAIGIGLARLVPAPLPEPLAMDDWRCGLDPADYAEGGCGATVTFCVGRCP